MNECDYGLGYDIHQGYRSGLISCVSGCCMNCSQLNQSLISILAFNQHICMLALGSGELAGAEIQNK